MKNKIKTLQLFGHINRGVVRFKVEKGGRTKHKREKKLRTSNYSVLASSRRHNEEATNVNSNYKMVLIVFILVMWLVFHTIMGIKLKLTDQSG